MASHNWGVCPNRGRSGHEDVEIRLLIFGLAEGLLAMLPYCRMGEFCKADAGGAALVRAIAAWLDEKAGPVCVPRLLARLHSFPHRKEADHE